MGWFFNRNRNDENSADSQDFKQNNSSFFQTRSSFSSTTKTCETDPEDSNFMICKTVIKDSNGTRQQEERIPANNVQSVTPSVPKYQPFSIFGNQENRNQNWHHPFNLFSRSFSKSTSCQMDPEDNQYMICKTKIRDEQGPREIEERVKASGAFGLQLFQKEMGNFGHEIDKDMHEFMQELNQGLGMMMPFIGSMVNFAKDLENFDKDWNRSQHHQHEPSQSYFPQNDDKRRKRWNENGQSRFGSSDSKKDTTVYDL